MDKEEDLLSSLSNLPGVLIFHALENLTRGENISLARKAGTARSELFNTLLPLFASRYQHAGFAFKTLKINHFLPANRLAVEVCSVFFRGWVYFGGQIKSCQAAARADG